MSMHFDLMVNLHQIGHLYLRRIDPTTKPQEIAPDEVCTYIVEILGERGFNGGTVESLYRSTIKHRFGDGAWSLIHKALGEYLAEVDKGQATRERPWHDRNPMEVPIVNEDSRYVDFTVKTGDPNVLHDTVQQLPGCVGAVIDGSWNGKTCVLRVFSGEGFLRFALPQQGYGIIVEDQ